MWVYSDESPEAMVPLPVSEGFASVKKLSGPPVQRDRPLPNSRDQERILPGLQRPVLADREAEQPRRPALAEAESLAIAAHHSGVGGERGHSQSVARSADDAKSGRSSENPLRGACKGPGPS